MKGITQEMKTGRIIKPYMVTSVDDLEKALEAEEIVICVKGESYNLLKDKIIESQIEAKEELKSARIGLVFAPFLDSTGIGKGTSRWYSAKKNLYVKYEFQDQPHKKCLDLVRVKGKGAFKPKEDKIDDRL